MVNVKLVKLAFILCPFPNFCACHVWTMLIVLEEIKSVCILDIGEILYKDKKSSFASKLQLV
jgi:hypothetical protein